MTNPHQVLMPALQLNNISFTVCCIYKNCLSAVFIFRFNNFSELTAAFLQQQLKRYLYIINFKCQMCDSLLINSGCIAAYNFIICKNL